MNFERIILEMKWISRWYSIHEICLILKQPKSIQMIIHSLEEISFSGVISHS